MTDPAIELDFYGKKVPYDGQPLGLYKVRYPDSPSSNINPNFGVFDPKVWEEAARHDTQQNCVDFLKRTRDEAAQQSIGGGYAAPLIQRDQTRAQWEKNQPSLRNTSLFCTQVLKALDGE